MNDVTLPGWRRIQLMAKERTSVSIGGVFKLAIVRQGTILARTKSLLPGCRADLSAVIQGPWNQETLMASTTTPLTQYQSLTGFSPAGLVQHPQLFFPSNVQVPLLHCVNWRTLPAAISLRAVTISRLSVTRSGFAPFKSCFALFDARITSWNRLVTFSRQSSTVTRAINIPSKRSMKTSDHLP